MNPKTIISYKLLIKKIEKGENEFHNLIIAGDLLINSSLSNKLKGGLIFTGCEFKRFHISNSLVEYGVEFYSCEFEWLEIGKSTLNRRLEIDGCSFGMVSIYHSSMDSINFIRSSLKELGSIKIDNCKIIGLTQFYDLELGQSIFLDDTEFRDHVIIGGVKCGHAIFLKSSVFRDKVDIRMSELVHGLFFDKVKLDKDLLIDIVDCGEYLGFENSNIDGNTTIEFYLEEKNINGNLEKHIAKPPKNILIESTKFNNGFHYLGNEKQIENSTKELKILCSTNLSGDFSFKSLSVKNLFIEGANHNSRIVFNGLKVDSLVLNKFSNFLELQLHRISPLSLESVFEIKESILGKTSIFDVNFRKFNKVVIDNSHLSDLEYSNIKWPDIIFTNDKSDTNRYLKERENYRQLKQLMSKQGDKVGSLEFEKKEWKSYSIFLKSEKKSFGDRFILWTNLSNDFGTNWIKPFGLFLGTVFLFYVLILFCYEDKISIWNSYQSGDAERFISLLKDRFWIYFHFLNPAHNLKHFLPKLLENNWGMFWNVLLRLFSGYFIFQMIRAFRKFTRR